MHIIFNNYVPIGNLKFHAMLELLHGDVIFASTAHKYRKINVKKSQHLIKYNILLSTAIIILCMLTLIKTDNYNIVYSAFSTLCNSGNANFLLCAKRDLFFFPDSL